MTLAMGNKNVIIGLLVVMLYLAMSFFIERTSALHQFHEKAAASWLALIGLLLFPLRDTIGFWGRYLDPKYSAGAMGPVLYPLMWTGGAAMFLSLLLSIVVFVQGTRQAAHR